ncbi:ATP-binding protein [Desulfovibrio cuneatus]|uniref:ATP-binding protein n=1 Tax=Desulfovibrio cuneatus TaxID=159728 RepID=UPI0004056489|nr:ATP-binding protein [Desulfovibrio cuneatus]
MNQPPQEIPPENTGTPHSPFSVPIAAFLGLASFVLLFVFIYVSQQSLHDIDAIANISAQVQEKSLPEMLENQRTFINIESLRRVAEVAYAAEDPLTRRNARINAQALLAESVFVRDVDFLGKGARLYSLIAQLTEYKDAVYQNRQILGQLSASFHHLLHSLLFTQNKPKEAQAMFKAFLASSLASIQLGELETQSEKALALLELQDGKSMQETFALCRAILPPEQDTRSQCKELENLFAQYSTTRRQIRGDTLKAREHWELIDETLREIRDNIGTESENASEEALTAIAEASEQAHQRSRILYGIAIAFLAGYLLLVHRYLARPVRWIAQKLREIQLGNLHVSMPTIRIAELYDVALMLDKFSVHLGDIYSHTSQLEEDAAEKRELEEVMATVFKASLDGYLVWDGDELKTVSPGFLTFLEVQTPQDVFDNWERFHFPPQEHLRQAFAKAIAQGYCREEITLTTAEGTLLPCEATHMRIDRPNAPLVLSYIRDLRIQKRNEKTLRQAKDEAEKAAQAKSDFLARMSHEIRTPMNGVLGLTHLAMSKSPQPEQLQFLTKIQASAKILLGVINDILDFSKIEGGKLTLDAAPFSFHAMTHTVQDLFQSQAEHKGLRLLIEADAQVPDMLKGDSLRLSQVMLNLCGNAIKFTEKGTVALRIHQEKETEHNVRLRFEVSDTGVGMTQEQLSRLFQPFAQADVSTTRKYGGTGLGLVISKLLVELMGGSIQVESAPGRGSTFYFTLTLAKASQEEIAHEKLPAQLQDNSSLAGLRILLAEDNEINQEIAVALLEDLGITVLVAGNGLEAVTILGTQDVNCVLMDIQMPVMDGLTAAKLIRGQGREAMRTVPIIAMTAHAMQEDRDKSIAAGMNDHITKPIDIDELQAKLVQWTSRG